MNTRKREKKKTKANKQYNLWNNSICHLQLISSAAGDTKHSHAILIQYTNQDL